MNLINDAWIPVRRADGSTEKIEPWRVTEDIGDEKRRILAVASPRSDFDGALVQFLIGLLQTTCTPTSRFEWRNWRRKPPTCDELRLRFDKVSVFFQLDGHHAFLQDASPEELTSQFEISALLLDSPGKNALDLNIDHFVKRKQIGQLCTQCAVTALLTLQINAPAGGQGYRTGLRGGGPLTTLVLGKTLWETCWLNVLVNDAYFQGFDVNRSANADRFPWMARTRTSESKPPAGVTTTIDVHPDQQFWAMPRRIRLLAEDHKDDKACSLCERKTKRNYTGFRTRNYGVNYQGFQHPLSPYYYLDGNPSPVHPQPGGIGYRHWLGLIENTGDNSRRPAKVIQQFRTLFEDGRLWAFGYDMDKMKARCWYDAVMPVLALPENKEASDLFKALVEQLVLAARLAADEVRRRTKTAMVGDGEMRGDLSFVTSHFWGATEAAFFAHTHRLRDLAKSGQNEQETMQEWLSELREKALVTFDRYASTGDFDIVNPRRIALARNQLTRTISSKKMRQTLGLPEPKKDKPKKRKGD
jgi:CRISPR system Cascade subunit CasA